jgi:hypothetical protein
MNTNESKPKTHREWAQEAAIKMRVPDTEAK